MTSKVTKFLKSVPLPRVSKERPAATGRGPQKGGGEADRLKGGRDPAGYSGFKSGGCADLRQRPVYHADGPPYVQAGRRDGAFHQQGTPVRPPQFSHHQEHNPPKTAVRASWGFNVRPFHGQGDTPRQIEELPANGPGIRTQPSGD